jgi:hypothetical protein
MIIAFMHNTITKTIMPDKSKASDRQDPKRGAFGLTSKTHSFPREIMIDICFMMC